MRIPKARGKFLQRNWDDVIFFFLGGGFGFSYTKMGGKLERTYPLASTKSSQQLSALSGFLNQKSEPIPWGRKPPWLPWMSGCLWRVWLVVPMIRRWKFQVHHHDAYLLSLYLVLGVGSWKHQHIQSNVNFDAWSEIPGAKTVRKLLAGLGVETFWF